MGVQLALFDMTVAIDKVDNFLFVDNLQTTVRQLKVFSAIIKHLNNKQLPKKILEQLVVAWSSEEEILNPNYKNGKGKATENGLKTAALGYYIQISTSLGFTCRFNDVYMNTKISQTFLYFLLLPSQHSNNLTTFEKIFYLYMILQVDADGIILCLSQLFNSPHKKQSQLQTEFKDKMSNRLQKKMDVSPNSIKVKIAAKYRTINFIWKKSKKYSEHIIAPRLEWLSELNLVNIKREQKDTIYSLSEMGTWFFSSLPSIDSKGLKDVTQKWINNHFFSTCNFIFNSEIAETYRHLSSQKQEEIIGEALLNAIKAVKSSLSFKLPVKETFLFIGMDLLVNKNIVINIVDIQDKLKSKFSYKGKMYLLKIAARSNEGYITVTLQK